MAASDGDVVSMLDVLQEDESLEDEANAVLGASDDKQCTYDQGCVKRQALYACATCSDGSGLAGICLACSFHCHDGHDLYELYTKRNFRCDCGNSKFGSLKCTLLPEKEPINALNKYNHNFKGLYCTCRRPYPDPDVEDESDMIQCVICEDWYHADHLKGSVPDCDDYHEMVCHLCMDTLPFLYAYLSPKRLKGLIDSIAAMPCTVNDKSSCQTENEMKQSAKRPLEDETVDILTTTVEQPSSKKRKLEDNGHNEANQLSEKTVMVKESPGKPLCKLTYYWTTVEDRKLDQAAFFDEGWRSSLCSCCDCKELYKKHELEFLFDDDDSVATYEAQGKLKGENPSTFERGLQALGTSLNRTQQVEMFSRKGSIDINQLDMLNGLFRFQ
jgi:E3 ubiquitin-protein ligase UBR7